MRIFLFYNPQPLFSLWVFFYQKWSFKNMQTTAEYITKKKSVRYVANRHHLTNYIGNTPLIELKNISNSHTPVKIYAKAEWFNPGGSVKDRAAYNMILDGLKTGKLSAEKSILDATSGNTGIAYAMIGASLGLNVTLCIPENAGDMHKQMIQAFGAQLIYTDAMHGTDGAIEEAKRLYESSPEKYYYVDQYNNEKNWQAHYHGTGMEIIQQTNGAITHFVAGLGSTGTFVGTGRRLKKYDSNIKLISVQPDSPLHGMEGMKHLETAHVPGIYDSNLADENIDVPTEKAQEMVLLLAGKEGLLVGNSAGAALAAALEVAQNLDRGIIVVIFPDAAFKYFGQHFWKEGSGAN
jgi:cysteine synthase B